MYPSGWVLHRVLEIVTCRYILSQNFTVAFRFSFFPSTSSLPFIFFCEILSISFSLSPQVPPLSLIQENHHVCITLAPRGLLPPPPRRRHRRSRLLLPLLQVPLRRKLHPHRRHGHRRRATRRPQQLASDADRRAERRPRSPVSRLPQGLHDRHLGAVPLLGRRHPDLPPARHDELSERGSDARAPGYRARCEPV